MILLKQIARDFIHLLFPDLCNACGAPLYPGETQICIKCLYNLPYTDFHLYDINPVARQFWGRIPIRAATALLYFRKGTKVQRLIHNLKYKDQTSLGIKLGNILGTRLLNAEAYQGITLVIPVPLHKKKERIRGYNQSKYIADGIAEILSIPVSDRLLLRTTSTESQTRKGRYKRFENMESAFSVMDPGALKKKHVLLVDDVMTTGSTLEACGIALLKCEIEKLSIATIAFAK